MFLQGIIYMSETLDAKTLALRWNLKQKDLAAFAICSKKDRTGICVYQMSDVLKFERQHSSLISGCRDKDRSYNAGYDEGRFDGYSEGHEAGYTEGHEDGWVGHGLHLLVDDEEHRHFMQ